MVAKIQMSHIQVVKSPVWLLKILMTSMELQLKLNKIVKKIKIEMIRINQTLKSKLLCIKMGLFAKMDHLESMILKRIKNLWKLLTRVMFQKNYKKSTTNKQVLPLKIVERKNGSHHHHQSTLLIQEQEKVQVELQVQVELSIKNQLTESQLSMRVHLKPTFKLDFTMVKEHLLL